MATSSFHWLIQPGLTQLSPRTVPLMGEGGKAERHSPQGASDK